MDNYIGKWVDESKKALSLDKRKYAFVARTENDPLDDMLKHIVRVLDVSSDDTILDVGCGTGLFSKDLSNHVKRYVGVDYSENNIQVAKETNSISNGEFYLCRAEDVKDIEKYGPFTKAMSYAMVQYLDYEKCRTFISNLMSLLPRGGVVLIGDIPDAEKRWSYYDTINDRFYYIFQRCRRWIKNKEGQDNIGYWYKKAWFSKIAGDLNARCTYIAQPMQWRTSRYRFDVILQKC